MDMFYIHNNFDVDSTFTDDTSFYEDDINHEVDSILASQSKFSPDAESTKIETTRLKLTPITNATSKSLTCVTPMTPARVHLFIEADSSLNTTHLIRKAERSEIIHERENIDENQNSASIDKGVQCVPSIDDISERIVEGCESHDDMNVPFARSFKNLPLASSTMIQRPHTSSTMIQRNASSRVSRRSSKPCASSTMIEDMTHDLTLDENSAPSVYTWSLDGSSNLLFVEDSYMRKTEKKIVSIFGKTGRARDAFCKGISLSSGDETIKYEDGRISDTSNGETMPISEATFCNASSEDALKMKMPLMSSTRCDFHQVPEYSGGSSVSGLQKISERPEIPGDDDTDASRVTPDNPSITAPSLCKEKPVKVNKFTQRFKLRRAKGLTALNMLKEYDNSPAKRELFQAPCSKENKKQKGIGGKTKVMRKLKSIGESFRSQGRQFQTLAVL